MSKHFSALKKMPVINNNGSLFNHTDKFRYMAQYSDGAFKEITNSRGDVKTTLKEGVGEIAAKYRHAVVKKCCHHGARRYKSHETCEERAARISIGPRCVQAFMECCKMAKPTNPTTDTFKISLLGKPIEHPKEIM
ncbi:hypothetical protein NL478_26190, partial [Klebsiella pneumoniae]|nr:hypothetical protein [Klebsiella pneumoniae]